MRRSTSPTFPAIPRIRIAAPAAAFVVAVVLVGAGPTAYAAGVYKWTDAQGEVHYGDAPGAPDATQMNVQDNPPPTQEEVTPLGSHGSQPASAPASPGGSGSASTARPAARASSPYAGCTQRLVVNTNLPRKLEKSDLNTSWAKQAIAHCENNLGTDCHNPDYISSWRPETPEQIRQNRQHNVGGWAPDWQEERDRTVEEKEREGWRIVKDRGDEIIFCR